MGILGQGGILQVPASRWQSLRVPTLADFHFRTPTSDDFSWWSTKQKDDPMFILARKLGLEVKYYDPPLAPWDRFFNEAGVLQLFLCAVIGWLWINRGSTGLVRQFAGASAILTMISWPIIYGQTGLYVVDFGIPAYAFLATLHFIDIFFTRDAEETKDWSYATMYAEALTFPKAEQGPTPRWTNAKALGLCLLKFAATNIILYSVPNAEIIKTVKSPLAWVGYHYAVGGCILMTLGWMIEGSIRTFGMILGIEQNPLFANPMGSPNLRLFWGRWNLVIKDGLHRAIFKPKKRANKSRAPIPAGKNGSRPQLKQRFSHKDNMSETEISEAEHHEVNNKKAPGVKQSQQQQQPPKKRGSFAKKAFAGMAAFIVSGAFHEYMNHLAFDGLSGYNMAFFVTHAILVIGYVWIQRNAPGVLNYIPNPLGVVIVNVITFFTSPLFCKPFVDASFFEQLKNGGIFGPVRGFIYLYGK